MHRFTNIQYVLFSLAMKRKERELGKKAFPRSPIELFKTPSENTIEVSSKNGSFQEMYVALEYFEYKQCLDYYASRPIDTVIEAIKALVYWNSGEDRRKFVHMANTIVERGVWLEDVLTFPLYNDSPRYNMPEYFVSGITQGKVASVLIRAYHLTHDIKYLNLCKATLKTYLLPINKGGAYRKVNGYEWIEEYPDKDRPSMVLNGHIFSLIGLGEYLCFEQDETLDKLYTSLIKSTLTFIPYYIQGQYLLYELSRWKLCNIHYLGIMTFLFKHINQMTGIDDFEKMQAFTKAKCNWKVFKFLMNNP